MKKGNNGNGKEIKIGKILFFDKRRRRGIIIDQDKKRVFMNVRDGRLIEMKNVKKVFSNKKQKRLPCGGDEVVYHVRLKHNKKSAKPWGFAEYYQKRKERIKQYNEVRLALS